MIFHLDEKDIKLLKELYEKVIKQYINMDPDDEININNFKKDFITFDKQYGYSSEINLLTKEETNIQSDLRLINLKFKNTPFYIWNFDKRDISIDCLNAT